MTIAVGIDLGATNARVALVDVAAGKILAENKHPWTDHAPETVAAIVGQAVREIDPGGKRCGVGIGFAGMLRGWSGVVVIAPNFGWHEVDFRGMLRAKVGEQCELYNDLNAIAYGESRYGSARGEGDMICVYVGTGVGSGIVLDGRLYSGSTHLAGELGHTKVVPNGRQCGCGMRGCLEAYTSGKNIQARAQEELRGGQRSLATDLAGGIDKVHAGFLDEAARRGDAYAGQLWEEVSTLLGLALANVVTTLNPRRLVMGGGVWQGAPELRRRAIARLFDFVNQPSREGFEVVDTALGDSAGMLGAAALISTPSAVAKS
ncbi:MAG TPA: ROK family protein [Polyangia bacterium]|nr:ROK family protein [Polyangia bacterium]